MAETGRELRRKRLTNAAYAMLIVGAVTAVFGYFSGTTSLDVSIMTNGVIGLALLFWYKVGPWSSPSSDRDKDEG